MAAKPIISVDVDSKQFDDFVSAYTGWQADVREAPKDWEAFGEAMSAAVAEGIGLTGINDMLDEMRVGIGRVADATETAIDGQGRLDTATEKTTRATHRLSEAAKSVAGAFVSVAKWMTIGGGLAGLATGAGLFGLDELARGVFTARRAASGVGVDMADQSAFRVNYSAFVDPDALLMNVANAHNDVNQQWVFRSLGIGGDQESRLNNADLSALVIDRVRAMIHDVPEQMLQAFAQAHGIDQLMGLEDLRRLRREPETEFGRARDNYERDRQEFKIPVAEQLALSEFYQALKRSGVLIETALARPLAHLSGPLVHLSEAVAHAISAFLGSFAVSEAIDGLATALDSKEMRDAIDRFTRYLSDPKGFSADVHKFFDDTKSMFGDLKETLVDAKYVFHTLADLLGKNGDDVSIFGWHPLAVDKPENHPGGFEGSPAGKVWHWLKGLTGNSNDDGIDDTKRRAAVDGWLKEHFEYPAEQMQAFVQKYAAQFGVPPEMLWKLYGAESGYGKNIGPSSAGAMGPFQFMPGTALHMGIDPMNPEDATKGAAHYLAELYAQFHDWRKAAAAYNWGPEKLAADLDQYGDDWEAHLPAETRRYLAKIFPNGAQYPLATPRGAGKDGYGDSRGVTMNGGFLGLGALMHNTLPWYVHKMEENGLLPRASTSPPAPPPAPVPAVPPPVAGAAPGATPRTSDLGSTLDAIKRALTAVGQGAGQVRVVIENSTAANVAASARGVAV